MINPPKLYEVNGDVTPIKTAVVTATVGLNRSIISAITEKRIRVMGLIGLGNSTSNVSQVVFKNGSGGLFLTNGIILDNRTISTKAPVLPIVDGGYFETDTGVGLFADVYDVDAALTVFYINYKP
jgi:hypothetical protein